MKIIILIVLLILSVAAYAIAGDWKDDAGFVWANDSGYTWADDNTVTTPGHFPNWPEFPSFPSWQ
jgi:hypothetical protein